MGLLTFGNRKYEQLDPVMRKTIGPLYDAMQQMMLLVDSDAQAFTDYLVRFTIHYLVV